MKIVACSSCGKLNRLPASDHKGRAICGKCKMALNLAGAPADVDESALAGAIAQSPVPVLVDFWAPWCGPCKMVAPVLEAVAKAHVGDMVVLKLNGDEFQQPLTRFGISGIPTMLLFKGGKEVGRQTGALPQRALEDWLRPHISG